MYVCFPVMSHHTQTWGGFGRGRARCWTRQQSRSCMRTRNLIAAGCLPISKQSWLPILTRGNITLTILELKAKQDCVVNQSTFPKSLNTILKLSKRQIISLVCFISTLHCYAVAKLLKMLHKGNAFMGLRE